MAWVPGRRHLVGRGPASSSAIPPPEAVEGRRIVVAIHLEGEIRNAMVKGERLRVGTQFLNLTDAERAYLDSQERLAVHW